MKIRKAIVTAAGFGTRMFPITKSVQKEMMPILERPIIDYIVNDCVAAGIEEIIFIVSQHDHSVEHYYSEQTYILDYLKKLNKSEKYAPIANLHTKCKFTFEVQGDDLPYGTAVPVMLAEPHVKDEEAFLILMGDDFFYHEDGGSEIKAMLETFEKSGAEGLITAIKVAPELVCKYGIATYKEENGNKYLLDQVEKPEPGEVDSDLATISKYIFTPAIFKYFEGQQLDTKSGELYFTYTYRAMAKEHNVVLHEAQGKYLDCGYLLGWLQANLIMAKSRPELWAELKNLLKD